MSKALLQSPSYTIPLPYPCSQLLLAASVQFAGRRRRRRMFLRVVVPVPGGFALRRPLASHLSGPAARRALLPAAPRARSQHPLVGRASAAFPSRADARLQHTAPGN